MKKVIVLVVLIIFVIFFCMCVSHANLCETAHEISKAQLRPLRFRSCEKKLPVPFFYKPFFFLSKTYRLMLLLNDFGKQSVWVL